MRYCLFFLFIFLQQILFAQKIPVHSDSLISIYKLKLSRSAVEKLNTDKNLKEAFTITTNNLSTVIAVLEKQKDIEVIKTDLASFSIIIKANTRFVKNQLLPLPMVLFIDVPQTAHPEISVIGYDRSFHGINAVDYLIPGAIGKNIVAGVKEQKMQEQDLDLWKRVLPSTIATGTISNHATVISTIIGGAGNSFYDGRGIAWGVKFFPSNFSNLFPDDVAVLNANKVTVQNHSYGTIIQQFYGAEALSYDAQTWSNKNIIHVFSAGNQGTTAATDGPYANIAGFANLTGNFKMAKNVITVGAIDNTGNIAAESSSGPLHDGRLAPQLTALGPNGTSDAAAIVSGTIAVMQQVYADSNNQAIPAASLVKSILYNTADDINNPAIDYKTGYGLLNSYEAIKSIQEKKYTGGTVANGQSWTQNLFIPTNTARIKLTLSWTDTTAAINNTKALVNDLDLELLNSTSSVVYKPWVLSAVARSDSLSKPAFRRRDSLNTAEQITVSLPSAGSWQVSVKGSSVINSTVPFHVAINIDTLNTFYFTSPQHSSDVNIKENQFLAVRWRTFVADTNTTGNLYISYNRGVSWDLVRSFYKIYLNQYQWPIKDTASTAVFKMETSFGNFLSKEFIISPVIRLKPDFVCSDSFRLSWNKHIYANAYRIWTLTDSPYLKPLFAVTDSFVVLNRNLYPGNVYAVEPLLANGIPASRSLAIDIGFQGVYCFYKSFNYNLLDENQVKLILELSIAEYVDSVFFEKLSASGQFLKQYGSAKVINGTLVYNQLIDSLPGGTIYVRAKLKLRNGQFVYTDILAVQTSGQSPIIFYPNPVNRNTSLNYVFRQGFLPGVIIKFYDVSGRLLRTVPLGATIDITGLPPGVLIYKLLYENGSFLGTGKIIVL